jgi:hypothetical protein
VVRKRQLKWKENKIYDVINYMNELCDVEEVADIGIVVKEPEIQHKPDFEYRTKDTTVFEPLLESLNAYLGEDTA